MLCGILLGFKLTTLFNIYDYSGAKDSGKVLIIIIELLFIIITIIIE